MSTSRKLFADLDLIQEAPSWFKILMIVLGSVAVLGFCIAACVICFSRLSGEPWQDNDEIFLDGVENPVVSVDSGSGPEPGADLNADVENEAAQSRNQQLG
jgi:hypothetical protein